MRIGTREVGPSAPVFVIAECGSNHGGSLDAALALIDAAAEAGADAAKFQRFRVDSFLVPRPNPETLRRYELPDEWLPRLRARCDERGIEFLCTAFDFPSLDIVDTFVNAHKVGSYEAVIARFVGAARDKGKPVLASTGRIEPGMRLPDADILLSCRSEYPADIKGYVHAYTLPWGVSDHTLDPTTVPAAAVALGACVVEKHFMLDFNRRDALFRFRKPVPDEAPPGDSPWHAWPEESPDTAVSIEPEDFAAMVRAIRATESAVRG